MAYLDTATGITVRSDRFDVTRLDHVEMEARRGGADAAPPVDEALEDGLRTAGFEIASVLLLHPAETSGRRAAEGAAELAVPVRPDEDVVLLVEAPGDVFSWRLPDTRETAMPQRRDGGIVGDVVVFQLDEDAGEQPQGDRRGPVTQWLAGKLVEPVRTYVLRFAAHAAIDFAVDRIEGDLVTGPVPIVPVLRDGGGAPAVLPPAAEWTPRPILLDRDKRIRRLLLLVHGTFSSTAASFGQLQANDEGLAFLAEAAVSYDLILGFDHKTLADTPADNAAQILHAIAALPLDRDCVIDAIAFSRGGLVYRTLAEQLLPASGLKVRLGKAVFVGCTNAGTSLARPANWLALADVYTNIALAAVRGAGLLTGGSFALIAGQIVRTLGRFVQILPQIAIGERYTPGLAAMEPESAVIAALNGARLSASPAHYHAITSSFEPSHADGRGMTRELARFLADRVTDRLFAAANDLVVHTGSMIDFGAGHDWIDASDLHAFGDTGEVFHTIYFASPTVATMLRRWLADSRAKAMDEPEPEPEPVRRSFQPVPWDSAAEPERLDTTPFSFGRSLPYGHVSLGGGAAPGAAAPEEDAATGGSEPATVQRYIAAEMQQYPRLSAPANVFVTVSTDRLVEAGHAAAEATDAPVELDRATALDIEIVPLANCAVVGEASQRVDPGLRETVLRFIVEGKAAGPAHVLVQARQGDATVASLTLRPEFLDGKDQVVRASQVAGDAAAADDHFVVLRIYEYSEGGKVRSLRFDLQGRRPDYALIQTLNLPTGIDLDDHMREVLADAENAWNLRTTDTKQALYTSFLSRFADSAKTRTEALLPKEVRELLWKHRDRIDAIQVISENPVIAWELMYLFDPDPNGESGDEGGFLAEWGLTRWLHGAPNPDTILGFDGADSRYVVPTYAGTSALPGAQAEKDMLAAQFAGIREIDAASLSVVDFLKRDAKDCDVLHFACHGKASSEGVMKGQLAMRGIVRDGKTIPDPLTIEQVRQNVRFGTGPRQALVFVNACQTGQSGYGLTGVSGFADAFLRPYSGQGAAAFVGALWSIDDKLALNFAEHFYAALRGGETLVAAGKAARKACQTQSDFTWLAYTIYGNPFARINRAAAAAGR